MNSYGEGPNAHEPAHLDSFCHEVQFYADDTLLLDGLQNFVADAILSGDAAVVIATESHRKALSQRLSTIGINVHAAIEDGRYIATDAARMLSKFMLGEWPDTHRFIDVVSRVFQRATAAVDNNHPRIVAYGEMVALLWAEGKTHAALRLEQLWNDLARMYSFSLRCAYPSRILCQQGQGNALLRVCEVHSHILADEGIRVTGGQLPRRILSISNNTRLLLTRNETLAVAGYTVASPKKPEEAPLLLATQSFDAVVIGDSVTQPQRGAIIRVLRSQHPGVPIVFVYADPTAAKELLADVSVDVSNDPAALIVALDKLYRSSTVLPEKKAA